MLDPAFHDRNDPVSCAAEALGLARGITTLLRTDPALPRNRVPAIDLDAIAQDCAEGAIFADAFDARLAAAIAQLDAFVGDHTFTDDWYPDAVDSLHAFPRCRRARGAVGGGGGAWLRRCFPSSSACGTCGPPDGCWTA